MGAGDGESNLCGGGVVGVLCNRDGSRDVESNL